MARMKEIEAQAKNSLLADNLISTIDTAGQRADPPSRAALQ